MNYNILISTYENNTLLFKTQTRGLIEDEFLFYHTDCDDIRINMKSFSFTKENIDTILKINREKCTLTLKELKQSLDIPIEYINFKNEENKLSIEYKLISQEEPLKINIEIGDEINEI